MTFKQLNLFGEPEPREPVEFRSRAPEMPVPASGEALGSPPKAFLPGINGADAFSHIESLEELRVRALACTQCRLRETCRQVVFGDGPDAARLMLVGEGPGEEEDRSGIPFVGRAGQLLDRILQAADFNRSEVYIGNVVKCRPPSNRLPNPDEVKICRNFLEAQIRIIRPAILVCLGSLASRTVIDPQASITRIRGQWFFRQGVKIIATFHPAALLRNEGYKRPVWEDFKSIRDEYRKLGNVETNR